MSLLPDGASRVSNAVLRVGGIPVGVRLADGTVWEYHKLDGWWSGPPRQDRVEDRPGADGGFDAPSLASPATYTIEGTIRAQSRAVAAAGLEALAALTDVVTLEVDDLDRGYRWCDCRVVGSSQSDAAALGVGVARWQLTLKAADPRKYGPVQSLVAGLRNPGSGGIGYPLSYPLTYGVEPYGGRVAFTNSGTAPTEPRLTVTGPLAAGFVVSHAETGRRLSYYHATAGLDLDCYLGTAAEDGQDRTMYLLTRDWFQVGPGQPATFAFASLGGETYASTPAPQMVVSVAPAYW